MRLTTTTESAFIKHIQCPKCSQNGKDNSHDNLAVYSDHSYCFSCGYYRKSGFFETKIGGRNNGDGIPRSDKVVQQKQMGDSKSIRLPDDFVLSIPMVGIKWLRKYQLTNLELVRHRIGWSENGLVIFGRGKVPIQYGPCMIFPVFDINGNLLMYQARYFGNQKTYPKYITTGKPSEIIHILGKGKALVIVEDLLSAIKVARHGRSCAIFGSNPSLAFWNRISSTTAKVILWLDPDKYVEAEKLKKRISILFEEVKVVHSSADPKECDDDYIKGFL